MLLEILEEEPSAETDRNQSYSFQVFKKRRNIEYLLISLLSFANPRRNVKDAEEGNRDDPVGNSGFKLSPRRGECKKASVVSTKIPRASKKIFPSIRSHLQTIVHYRADYCHLFIDKTHLYNIPLC